MKSSPIQTINLAAAKVNLPNDFRNIFYIAECDFGKGLFSKIDIKKGENIFNLQVS
jgi:hypothetical protein